MKNAFLSLKLVLFSATAITATGEISASRACSLIQAALPGKVFYPGKFPPFVQFFSLYTYTQSTHCAAEKRLWKNPIQVWTNPTSKNQAAYKHHPKMRKVVACSMTSGEALKYSVIVGKDGPLFCSDLWELWFTVPYPFQMPGKSWMPNVSPAFSFSFGGSHKCTTANRVG